MSKRAMVGVRIEGGRVVMGVRSKASWMLQVADMGDGEALLTTERATRSLAQNAYLWGVVYAMIAEDTGNTPEAVHEFCKLNFNTAHFTYHDDVTGEMVDERIGGSTAGLAKDAFGEYIERVRQWAALERGLNIPDPGETNE